MNCERVQESYVESRAGLLPPGVEEQVSAHLKTCAACRAAWAELGRTSELLTTPVPSPSPELRVRFQEMLALHQAEDVAARAAPWSGRWRSWRSEWQLAAAAVVLLFGIGAGVRFGEALAGRRQESAAQAEVARLSARLDDMDRLVTASLVQQKSAGERLRDVQAVAKASRPDQRMLTDLAGALAFEPSVNVRYSTVEALAAHADEPVVRAGVRAILPREQSTLVQLAMIELLAEANDQEAVPAFDRLVRDENTAAEVREAARRALIMVSNPASPHDRPSGAKPTKKTSL